MEENVRACSVIMDNIQKYSGLHPQFSCAPRTELCCPLQAARGNGTRNGVTGERSAASTDTFYVTAAERLK